MSECEWKQSSRELFCFWLNVRCFNIETKILKNNRKNKKLFTGQHMVINKKSVSSFDWYIVYSYLTHFRFQAKNILVSQLCVHLFIFLVLTVMTKYCFKSIVQKSRITLHIMRNAILMVLKKKFFFFLILLPRIKKNGQNWKKKTKHFLFNRFIWN